MLYTMMTQVTSSKFAYNSAEPRAKRTLVSCQRTGHAWIREPYKTVLKLVSDVITDAPNLRASARIPVVKVLQTGGVP